MPLNVIQRQLGHRNLGVTSIYLQGIDPDEIIETVRARPARDPCERRPSAATLALTSSTAPRERFSTEGSSFEWRGELLRVPDGHPGHVLDLVHNVRSCVRERRDLSRGRGLTVHAVRLESM